LKRRWTAWTVGKWAAILLVLVAAALLAYGAKGYFDALASADRLSARADRLIAAGRGPEALGPGRAQGLLRVEDPGFAGHAGVDLATPGAGMTSITQSLAKRLAFTRFRPGLRKLRQTGYALGLERRLSKRQILTLFLDTSEMGYGPRGWMTGFFTASREIFGRDPAGLSDRQFLSLVAVSIAPRLYDLRRPSPALADRVARIERLVAGRCRPEGHRDVWLAGCGSTPPLRP
jgi:monofunctional biosynthetic peptidoglycan transglycosylase